jgi:hypothetical protein
MGKASQAKKVSRAARTGGGRTSRRSNFSWGYPLALTMIVAIGVVLVVFSRGQHTAAADSPTVNDHWHSAYGFDVCGDFLPNLPQPPTLIGLHTHGDGVIHIEPQDPILDTGKNATLGRFISGYPGLKVSTTSFTVINKTWSNGDKCGDKVGRVSVRVDGSVVKGNPNKARISKDGWVTIAFLPVGELAPAPPDWHARDLKADGTNAGHSSTTMPGATPTTGSASTPTSEPVSLPTTIAPPGTPTTTK